MAKEKAFRSGDKEGFKEAKYMFSKEVRKTAKQLYSEKLQHQLSDQDTASVCQGLPSDHQLQTTSPPHY